VCFVPVHHPLAISVCATLMLDSTTVDEEPTRLEIDCALAEAERAGLQEAGDLVHSSPKRFGSKKDFGMTLTRRAQAKKTCHCKEAK
jgi:hypothetical protein